MARLPNPGSDSGVWGDVLNDFLSQSHDSTGILRAGSVGSGQLQTNAVVTRTIAERSITLDKLTTAAIASLQQINLSDGSVSEAKLEVSVRNKLNAPFDTTAVANATSTYAVPRPTTPIAEHTAYLLGHLQAAKDAGCQSVVIPYLNQADSTVRWVINSPLVAWSGLRLWVGPIQQNNIQQPVVLVPPAVSGATIECVDAQGVRVAWTDYNSSATQYGSSVLGAHTGVLCHGNRTTIRGYYHHFRNGVRLGNWSGVGNSNDGYRYANDVDALFDTVDFGVVYYRQHSFSIKARGSYVITPGSPDAPHLIYATQSHSINGVVEGDAWDSLDGTPFIFKAYDNLTISSLSARNTTGIAEFTNELGPLTVGTISGIDINLQGQDFLKPAVNGMTSQPWASPTSTKLVNSIKVNVKDGMPASQLRPLSLNDGWMVNSIDITYNLDETATSQALIHISGNDSYIGAVRIINRGSGGVIGLRYAYPSNPIASVSGHVLAQSPFMRGVSSGVVVLETYVNDITLNVFDSTIKTVGSGVPVAMTPGTGRFRYGA